MIAITLVECQGPTLLILLTSAMIKKSFKTFLDAVSDPDRHQNQIICSLCHCQHFLEKFHQTCVLILQTNKYILQIM